MNTGLHRTYRRAAGVALSVALMLGATIAQADITRFLGSYEGTANVVSTDGSSRARDMSVEITEIKDGFRVRWTSITYRDDGTSKEKSYTIDFEPSEREGLYAAAMKRNVFGHNVQLDPMKGEPYVWGRIDDGTLSIYSMFVTEDGGYEIQKYDRTLAEGGLDLEFESVLNGQVQRTVSTFLEKQ